MKDDAAVIVGSTDVEYDALAGTVLVDGETAIGGGVFIQRAADQTNITLFSAGTDAFAGNDVSIGGNEADILNAADGDDNITRPERRFRLRRLGRRHRARRWR